MRELEAKTVPVDPKFALGRIVATQGASALAEAAGLEPVDRDTYLAQFLDRHVTGDWGDVEDPAENEEALTLGNRLLSVYETEGGPLWVITEWDRSSTTFLLPSEY